MHYTHGQCHCGAILYEAQVEPDSVVICHCADCQMQSGSIFRMNVPAAADHFRILKGVPKIYLKTTPGGSKRAHAFCGDCGGPVYSSAAEGPQSYSLRVGALRQRYELGRPVREIWTKRRFPWLPRFSGTQEFDAQP
jgi:hypothetical protein